MTSNTATNEKVAKAQERADIEISLKQMRGKLHFLYNTSLGMSDFSENSVPNDPEQFFEGLADILRDLVDDSDRLVALFDEGVLVVQNEGGAR